MPLLDESLEYGDSRVEGVEQIAERVRSIQLATDTVFPHHIFLAISMEILNAEIATFERCENSRSI